MQQVHTFAGVRSCRRERHKDRLDAWPFQVPLRRTTRPRRRTGSVSRRFLERTLRFARGADLRDSTREILNARFPKKRQIKAWPISFCDLPGMFRKKR